MNDAKINFQKYDFAKVVDMPDNAPVLDLTQGPRSSGSEYSIGRYNERRPGLYQGELYDDERCIHVGIDLGGPVGTAIHSFYEGEILLTGNNDRPFDYGGTIITKHVLDGIALYALWGHLSLASLEIRNPGESFAAGDLIGYMGDERENGGWPPHLHLQLSYEKPEVADLPGVVSAKDLPEALKKFPDPRLVLGPIY